MEKRYTWTSINLGAGVLLGIGLVYWFAWSSGITVSTPLLWAFAYYVVGALLGFIFSVPKIITDDTSGIDKNIAGKSLSLRYKIEENTNLTQISDWLTKILIGAGLVQLGEAPGFILRVAKVMAQGMRNDASEMNTIDGATVMCAALIIYFTVWGFISGYIVMRLVLTEQFAMASDGHDNATP
jgi:hypothetical protein